VILTAFLLRKAMQAMKAQGYGRIVNLYSSAGREVGTLGGAPYIASEAGLVARTRSGEELSKFGITVNAVLSQHDRRPGASDGG
jgi:ketoreductase